MPQPTAPLRVLLGADTFPPEINGAAVFTARLAAGLSRKGHDVHIVAPAASARGFGTSVETHEGARLTVHRLRSWRWYPHPWLRYALPWRIERNSARLLDRIRPDVVHFQSHIVVGRGLARQARLRGIRLIGTNHFMPENLLEFTLVPGPLRPWATRLAWAAAARTFGLADAVTTPTARAARFLEENTGLRGVVAISCGVDASSYTPDFEPRSGNLIVFVGRVTGEKQLDTLLTAFSRLDPRLDARLEIVGDGELTAGLTALARTLGVADRVTFTGHVDDRYLRDALTRATVFAMPSIAELQSIATLEAMASALPIVAANAMALPHLVQNNVNGFLFAPGDADDFAAKLTRVLRMDDRELGRLKQESLRLVRPHDLGTTVGAFEAMYRQAASD